jgi:predicted alpha/beta hydrolase
VEEIALTTEDGAKLAATLFESNAAHHGDGPLVLISSATAVRRTFYRHFAQFVADAGARAVMTYDYRGIDKPLPGSAARAARAADWATKDFPAAVRELLRRHPGARLNGIGHSFGGQALGLSGMAPKFSRYMTICAGSGWLGHTRERDRLHRRMNWVGGPLAAVLGNLPAWSGFGVPLPSGVFQQWRRWCNARDYFMSDPDVPETKRFAEVRIAMMAVGFDDDPWMTRESVADLMAWYSNADIRLRWFSREESGGEVGHFGFFRPEHRETLWPQISDWLVHTR